MHLNGNELRKLSREEYSLHFCALRPTNRHTSAHSQFLLGSQNILGVAGFYTSEAAAC